MSASSRGGRVLGGALSASARKQVCFRCAAAASIRPFSSAAAVESTVMTSQTISTMQKLSPASESLPYDLYSGVILTRAPLLTRKLHPFENAFFFYQKRLEERLCSKFIPRIYYKKDTVRLLDWEVKIKERKGHVAKELGEYQGQNSMAWDDELRVGDRLSEPESMVECLLKDAESRVSDDAEVLAPEDVVPVPRPASRETEADRVGDVTRLDRKLDRTLYLVVKGNEGWGFPAGVMGNEENLHEAARRVLDTAAGVDMNTWIIGRVPVAHIVAPPVVDANGSILQRTRKTFFLKARIIAGQANLSDNPFGFTQFKWLVREEVEEVLAPEYFQKVRNMMPDR
ncbi:hypothetical protein CDD80_3195 [Ophiocordyceps camponoti-rufipedis]|uniref:Large ribosomal subunit protein mL46 n=1 Tax=Ophiocordyceps camponoti-rufipedis TaxID=2004952 RepID=A0A2C5Z3K1_9HYPO|nr:hypothetical protein CDD80_3195 [Ophiocordyceps camponoti-rufipedis]